MVAVAVGIRGGGSDEAGFENHALAEIRQRVDATVDHRDANAGAVHAEHIGSDVGAGCSPAIVGIAGIHCIGCGEYWPIGRNELDIGIVREQFELAWGNRVVSGADKIERSLEFAAQCGNAVVMNSGGSLTVYDDDVNSSIRNDIC